MRMIDASTPLRVYLVEDDDDLREDMALLLGSAGFEVLGLADAPAFYKAHALAPCEVVVLDIGLDGEDGLSLASQLRASGSIGIVMASARGAVEDRIAALRQGADVYMVKPVHVDELSATIRMLGSRVRSAMQPANASAPSPPSLPSLPSGAGWRLTEGDWMLCDPEGKTLKLTSNERGFLAVLMRSHGGVVSRNDLLAGLEGEAGALDPKRLDVIASRLRRKSEQAGMRLPLHVVRGAGYQFAA